MSQTLNYKFSVMTINFYPYFFQIFKEKLRKQCLPDLISSMIVTFSYLDIS